MTKLLLITSEFPPQPGGIGNHAHHVAKALLPHHFFVTVLTDQRSKLGVEETQFDNKQAYTIVRVRRQRFLAVTYCKRIIKALRLQKKHDVILVSGKFSIWIAGILRFITSKKIVAVLHGSEVAMPSSAALSLTRWSLKRCSYCIAVSNFTKSLVSDWGLKSISVIPNGFDSPVQSSSHKRIEDSVRLITVGNVTQRKGQHNVVKALPMLLKRFPKLTYDIVGIPTEMENLKKVASQLAVSEAVVFHGSVSEERKVSLLEKASIFVMLSETTKSGDVEGFGIAILEANALAIPSIGAKGCGIEDAISHNKSGILIDPHKPEELKEAIETILLNYTAFSEGAKEWSVNFTWDKIIISYKQLVAK